MKKILFVLVILILFFVFIAYNNSNPRIIISQLLKDGDIQKGKLIYRIYLFGVLPVGEASLDAEKIQKYRGRQVYHLRAAASSAKVFSKFFSAQAILDSYVDRHKLYPIVFKQNVAISGKPDIQKEVTYDQDKGVMSIANVRRKILPNTQDPLSATFNIRRMDFDKVKEIELNINTNQKNYVLKGRVTQEDLIVDKKTHKIILAKAEIKRRSKSPYHQSRVTMILLKKSENLPILIKVFASGVLINVKLIRIEK